MSDETQKGMRMRTAYWWCVFAIHSHMCPFRPVDKVLSRRSKRNRLSKSTLIEGNQTD